MKVVKVMHKYWIKWHWRHDFTQLAAPAFPRGCKEYSVNADAVYRRSMRVPLDWTDEYIGIVTYDRELAKAEMKEYHLERYSVKKDLEMRWAKCKRSVIAAVSCFRR